MSKSEVVVHESAAPLERFTLDPQALIQSGIEKGSGIEVMERLFDLAKNVNAERARMAWFDAMAIFQQECPPITKSSTAKIQTRSGGSYSYSYATLDDIMGIIAEPLGKNGLSVSYRVRQEGQNVVAVCRISHRAGHYEESGDVAMPVVAQANDGAGAMGANPAQRVGIAMTYAKRYALLAITGLAPERDEDEDGGDPGVQEPRRASEAAPPPPASAGAQTWQGQIKSVTFKDGTTNGKPWRLYTIAASDGKTYSTFDSKSADFAGQAGLLPVVIQWEQGPKGRRLVSIGPATREPGDEEAGA